MCRRGPTGSAPATPTKGPQPPTKAHEGGVVINPPGKVTDYGDLLHIETWLVKGRHYQLAWHIGAPQETEPDDRVVQGTAVPPTGRIDLTMDLMADQQVPLSIEYTDEMGNPTTAPADGIVAYTVDDPSIINLTDNGDGTAIAAAVGPLGAATVHVEATAGGVALSGDLQIVVVAGLADRLNVVAGEPTEVTPDA